MPHFNAWLGLFFIIFAVSLFHTYILFGEWSRWGLSNKLPGIVVIAAYACLGGWMATNLDESRIALLLRAMAGFFIALMLVETTFLIWQDIAVDTARAYAMWPNHPLEGFMDNRNAYALFALIMFSFMLCFSMSDKPLLPRPIVYVAMGVLPYFILQIGSRAGFIALTAMAIALILIYRTKLWPYILATIIGGMVTFLPYTLAPERLQLFPQQQDRIIESLRALENPPANLADLGKDTVYQGDSFRIQVLSVAFDMLKERPFLGSGLGSSHIVQEKVRGRHDIIENTPLWLWVETGLIGLAAFSVFYFLCMRAVVRNMKGDDFYTTLNRAMFVSIIIFTVMTMLHEMMMTRQVWFLLGLALALPAAKIKTRQDG